MATEEIRHHCMQLIADSKKIPIESIHSSSTFEELGLDSLDKVTLTFEVEEAYDIEIPESALSTIQSVDQMVAGVEKAVADREAATALRAKSA